LQVGLSSIIPSCWWVQMCMCWSSIHPKEGKEWECWINDHRIFPRRLAGQSWT
jgi:hypothetical protein